MGVNAWLAAYWEPVDLVIVGVAVGLFVTLVYFITQGISIPQEPGSIVASVLFSLALVFLLAGGLLKLNEHRGGTKWRYENE